MLLIRCLWVMLAAIASLPLIAAEKLQQTQLPNWVTSVAFNQQATIPESQLSNGVFYHLFDRQVKVGVEQKERYFHLVKSAVNVSGLEQLSQLNIDYDPSFQQVLVHEIKVWRDGKALDRFSSATFSFLQRERELEKRIYNGIETLNVILADIRIGDKLEYSYSIIGENPVFKHNYGATFSLQWGVPMGRAYLRLLWQKNTKLQFQFSPQDRQLDVKTTDQGIEYVYTQDNVAMLDVPDDVPEWYRAYSNVQFSEFSSWRAVTAWAKPLFNASLAKSDNNIQQIAQHISAQSVNDQDKIARALRFVQSEVRYLGIEFGANSHQPRAAIDTLARRYGDCKDKTVLLISLLAELNIKAYPALVATNLGLSLQHYLPSNRLFDHVITYVEHAGQGYWLDPTLSTQLGDLAHLYQPNYGWALRLSPNDHDLINSIPTQGSTSFAVKERYTIPQSAAAPVELSIKNIYRGQAADLQRLRIDTNGLEQVKRDFMQFYQRFYEFLEVIKTAQFDDMGNVLIANEQYRINNFWQFNEEEQTQIAYFYPNTLLPSLKQPIVVPGRKHPLAINFPLNLQHQTEVTFAADNWVFEDEFFEEDNAFFLFRRAITFDKLKRMLSIDYLYETKQDHIPAAEIDDYITALERLKNYREFGIFIQANNPHAPEENESQFSDDLSLADAKPVQPEAAITAVSETGTFLIRDTIVTLWFGILFVVLVVWLFNLSVHQTKASNAATFYPVPLFKLFCLWLSTFGLYSIYWFYKNWQYIKQREAAPMMPLMRGLFSMFWFFSLYRAVAVSVAKDNPRHAPSLGWCALLSGAYFLIFALSVLTPIGNHWALVFLLLSVLCVIPMANTINHLNDAEQLPAKAYSPLKSYHVLFIVLMLPLNLVGLGAEIGLLPANYVINGENLGNSDRQFLQRYGLIAPGQKVEYFYSDAIFSNRDDGNGVTKKHVFSYWKEGGLFYKQVARFNEIHDIDVTWSDDLSENTVLNIMRKDGSSFPLFVSNEGQKDQLFVKRVLDNWRVAQPH